MPAATIEASVSVPESAPAELASAGPEFSAVESGFFDAGELIALDPEAAAAVAAIDADFVPRKPSLVQLALEELHRVRRPLAIAAAALFVVGASVGVWAASGHPSRSPIATVAAAEPARAAPTPVGPRAPRELVVAARTPARASESKRVVVGPVHAPHARAHAKHGRGARAATHARR